MSELIVEVCEVLEVNSHPNADKLDVIRVKGWDVVVQKDLVKPGDPIVFFPPDSVLTEELADRLGIRKYLVPVKDGGDVSGYRVRAARLRGVASYGAVDHSVPDGAQVGADVAGLYGVKKWEPPVRSRGGGGGKQGYLANVNAAFHKYKSIEHLRNHRDAFRDGELVSCTEKIHGTNVRVGLIKTEYDPGVGIMGFLRRCCCRVFGTPRPTYELTAGSHHVQREVFDVDGGLTLYATPLGDPNVVRMLRRLSCGRHDVILFGELYGHGIQDMVYGCKEGEVKFAAFDVAVDGRYLDVEEKNGLFAEYGIPSVPVLYMGPYSWNVVESLTDGPTTVCDPEDAGPFKGREGVVVTCLVEPRDYPGRKIYKSVSADYLARGDGTDSH